MTKWTQEAINAPHTLRELAQIEMSPRRTTASAQPKPRPREADDRGQQDSA